jgi:peptidoglycan biosynthesis protein MviN/MurJ (putative lipid II flippase)
MLNAVSKFRAAAASPILLNVAMIGACYARAIFRPPPMPPPMGCCSRVSFSSLFVLWAAAGTGLVLR